MRSLLLLSLLLAATATAAQGVYVPAGTGGSLTFARATQTGASGTTAETSAIGVAVESVSGYAQSVLGVSYSSPSSRASVLGLSAKLGLLLAHQHRGAPVTFALNGGFGVSHLKVDGVGVETVQYLTVGPELGGAISMGPRADLVPLVSAQALIPLGIDGGESAVAVGGALGVSIGTESGFRFVLEPGLAALGDVTTFPFALKVFKQR